MTSTRRFIELAGEMNISMPYHVVASTAEALNKQRKSSEWRQGADLWRGVQERY